MKPTKKRIMNSKKWRNISFFILLFSFFILPGCNNDEFGVPDKPATSGGDIEFNIGFAPQAQTRVATDAQFKSTWENGDQIGVFAVKRATSETKALATTGNYMHNVKLTYSETDGKWTTTSELWHAAGSEVLDFYAYYPYIDNASIDPTSITFNVLADQSTAANYNLSDLLSAAAPGIAKSTASVDLTFAHKLALVQVEVDPTYIDRNTDFSSTLRNCLSGGAFNLGDGTLSTAGDAVAVKMLRVEQPADANYGEKYTYRALVPAQTVAQNSSLCLMAQNGQPFNTPKLAAELSLTAGAAKLYTAKLPATALQTVKIPAGSFIMGSSNGTNIGDTDGSGLNTTPAEPNRNTNETQHSVTLTKDFYMSKYQITFAQYDAFCDATGKKKPGDESWGRGDHPVIYVSWHDAVAYCTWLSEQTGGTWRLPTEAEWEYACRGDYANKATEAATLPFGIGNGRKLVLGMANYSTQFSYDLDGTPPGEYDVGNNTGYLSKTSAVGQYTANNYGLYDMHGNVWEWCSDRNGTYGNTAATDPTGPGTGLDRVLRGGSWYNYAQNCRSAFRFSSGPDRRSSNVGFRVVFVPIVQIIKS